MGSGQLPVGRTFRQARFGVAVKDTVLPGDAEDTLEAPHVEGVEAALLAHVCGPRFAAIEEGALNTQAW